jgi:hypothetical protein
MVLFGGLGPDDWDLFGILKLELNDYGYLDLRYGWRSN